MNHSNYDSFQPQYEIEPELIMITKAEFEKEEVQESNPLSNLTKTELVVPLIRERSRTDSADELIKQSMKIRQEILRNVLLNMDKTSEEQSKLQYKYKSEKSDPRAGNDLNDLEFVKPLKRGPKKKIRNSDPQDDLSDLSTQASLNSFKSKINRPLSSDTSSDTSKQYSCDGKSSTDVKDEEEDAEQLKKSRKDYPLFEDIILMGRVEGRKALTKYQVIEKLAEETGRTTKGLEKRYERLRKYGFDFNKLVLMVNEQLKSYDNLTDNHYLDVKERKIVSR